MANTLLRAYGWRGDRLTQQIPPAGTPSGEQTTALALRSQTSIDPDWQRFWLNLAGMPWQTLALIPAGSGAPADFTMSLAIALSRTGMTHVGAPILVADGTQVPLRQLNAFLADVRACSDAGERVIVALSPVSSDATTVAIAKTVDRCLLCVMLGRMLSAEAKRTLSAVGPSKFLGSVIIRGSDLVDEGK
jgi:hypothetical protein